jgi:hypothetical protein
MQSAMAAPISLQCPKIYPGSQDALALQKNGWRVPPDNRPGSALSGAGILIGMATDNGELRGADLSNGTGREFNFAGTDYDGAKWFYCQYGTRGGARLVYEIPVSVKQCKTVERLVHRRFVEAGLRCE